MKKTKILIYVPQLLESGGIESHLKEFCRNMNTENYDLFLLVANFKGTRETKQFYQSVCKKVWLIQNNNNKVRLLQLILTLLFIKKNNFQILYTNGQGNSIYHIRSMLSKNINWIHHHHTSGDQADQKTWPNRYKLSLKKCETLIACAEPNAIDIEKATQRQVTVIPCFSVQLKPKKFKYPIEGKVRLGYYGRLIKEKGINLLCELSLDSDLKDIEFYVWGKGNAYPASYFKKYQVKYMGHFSNKNEINEIIENIDGFVLISEHPEGLPISLLEIMSTGIPWLATDRGGIKSISIDPILNYILPYPSDYVQTKKLILQFANSIKKKNTIWETQIKKYETTYAAEVIIQQWKTIFSH